MCVCAGSPENNSKPTETGPRTTSLSEEFPTDNAMIGSDRMELVIVLSVVSLAAVLIALIVIALLVVCCYFVSKHRTSTENHNEHNYDYPICDIPTHSTPTTSNCQQHGIYGQRHNNEFISMTQNIAYYPVMKKAAK